MLNDAIYLKDVETRYIPVGYCLYRFINKPPKDVKIGTMHLNRGEDGRFNKYRNIYYCCNNMFALVTENRQHAPLRGSLVLSKTFLPLQLGQVCGENLLKKISGLTDSELNHLKSNYPQFYGFKEFLGFTGKVDYTETSKMAEILFKYFPDGIAIPPVMGFPNGINGLCVSDDNQYVTDNYDLNIVLTKVGYRKLIEHKPIVYWHN